MKLNNLFTVLLTLIASFSASLMKGFSLFAEVIPVYQSTAMDTNDAGLRANYDVKDVIFKDNEDVTVFTRLGMAASRERANGVKVTYFEQYNKLRRFTPSEDQAAGGTTIKVAEDKAKHIIPGMEFKIVTETVPTTNQTVRFRVTSIGSTTSSVTTINITPIYGTTLIAVSAAADKYLLVSIWKPQGSTRPEALNNLLVEKVTYTRIFDGSYSVNGSLAEQKLFGETERNRQKTILYFDHGMDIESAIYNAGARREPTAANGKLGTPEGVIYTILNESDNVYYEPSATVPGYTDFTVKKLKKHLTQLGGLKNVQGKHKTKTTACTGSMLQLYNELAEDKIVTMREVSNQVLGIEGVQEVRYGQVKLLVFESQQMNDIFGENEDPAQLEIDPNFFEVRPFRDTLFQANVQDTGADLKQDMVRTELSWILSMANKHGMFFKKGAY